ncbi:MAG TPA: 4'-phosphopantetheinyl transferase superfamily protein [Pirellulales bacterium]|nr:4'-phosphopantetheinyl transferase superfamily protein [Pirellulales bacterium]
MTSPETRLRQQIADVLNVPADTIVPDTALDVPRFRSSAGAMILQSLVRSATGKTIATAGVRNFGELLSRVTGEAHVNGTPEAAKTPAAIVALPSAGNGASAGPAGCGVDIEDVETLPAASDYWAHDFYTTHFSPEEIAYCVGQADPRPHFAARWCAKEALKKASPAYLPLALADVQVVRHPAGNVGLQTRVGGVWQDAPAALSLSHSERSAVAMVILPGAAPVPPMASPAQSSAPAPASAGQVPSTGSKGRKSWLRRLLRPLK